MKLFRKVLEGIVALLAILLILMIVANIANGKGLSDSVTDVLNGSTLKAVLPGFVDWLGDSASSFTGVVKKNIPADNEGNAQTIPEIVGKSVERAVDETRKFAEGTEEPQTEEIPEQNEVKNAA